MTMVSTVRFMVGGLLIGVVSWYAWGQSKTTSVELDVTPKAVPIPAMTHVWSHRPANKHADLLSR